MKLRSLLLAFLLPLAAFAVTGTAPAGKTVTLGVTANGTLPFSYQWAKDGKAISGATSASLVLASAQISDSGTYTVTVSNVSGSTLSDNAVVTITAASTAPVFTTQPQDQKGQIGGFATFSSGATGTPTPTFQWFKDGVAIPGAVNTARTVGPLTMADAGTYTVKATNAGGTTVSAPAVLTVMPIAPTNAVTTFNSS